MNFLKSLKWSTVPLILSLAWPTVLEQFMQTAVQYIDTAMVGSLGTAATAAVGSTTTINWLVNGTVSAMGIGFLSFIAQSFGSKNINLAKRASAQGVLATLVIGILFTVLTLALAPIVPSLMQVDDYLKAETARYFFILYSPMLARTAILIFGTVLRAAGDTKTPMLVGIVVNLVNVVLNFILIYPTRTLHKISIYGAGMGVSGAALASAISFVIGGVLITVALLHHKEISPIGMRISPDMQILKPCFKIALPNMLQRFATYLGYVVFASMINALGDMAIAAHTIANTVESAFYVPGYGMQTAAATLAGNAYGAKDKRKMQDVSRMILVIEIGLMIISGALLFIFAKPMMALFSKDGAVIALGTRLLKMVALSEPIFGAAIILEGIMFGVGYTVMPFVYNIIGMWGVRICGTFLMIHIFNLGLISAWCCMLAHNVLLFVMLFVCYIKGKWNPLK